ncbi:DUF2785 domain-containing protein [Heyndrickxia sp. NPDC080065]|uniref:DUF2785 domain-containing protein n=1 Tax=Heyndrickxia sp. NPDC080065 TaxID=3390568 RepID=UPI003D084207
MLKDKLYEIMNNDYALPEGLNEFEAVQQVIAVLGSTDAELRDNLGYHVLAKWLLDKKFLTNEQLEKVLEQAISKDLLLHKIGEVDSDSVFQRTFSSLLIALILIRDNRDPFLSEISFRNAMDRIIIYCELEKDYRSYIEGKGWAHGPAHISDAIDECVQSRFTGMADCESLWNSLMKLLINAPQVFDAEEDERIATAVTTMVETGKVSIPTLCHWLGKVVLPEKKDIPSMNQRINFKHFLRSLIIRLQTKGLISREEHSLIEIERTFNTFL